MAARAVNTSSKENSIWKGLDKPKFRQTIIALATETNEVPTDPKSYTKDGRRSNISSGAQAARTLSFEDEQRLADDLAYLAASQEGVGTVTAVVVEELSEPPGLLIRIAANEGVGNHLNRGRIHARLRSKHWKIPGYRLSRSGRREEALHQSLRTLLPDLRKDARYRRYLDRLTDLCDEYEKVDVSLDDSSEELKLLQGVVRKSYDLYHAAEKTSGDALPKARASKFSPSTRSFQNKHVQQVNKIGRYWALCIFLTKAAHRYASLFNNCSVERVLPYTYATFPGPSKGTSVKCFVHAEIQIIVFYDLLAHPRNRRPRVVGVSKSVCYLCQLFIEFHGDFQISKAHGRLYDQWTVPDLNEFGPAQRRKYRQILQQLNEACKAARPTVTHGKSTTRQRPYPLTSTLNLHEYGLLSSIASSTATMMLPHDPRPRSLIGAPFQTSAQPVEAPIHIIPIDKQLKIQEAASDMPLVPGSTQLSSKEDKVDLKRDQTKTKDANQGTNTMATDSSDQLLPNKISIPSATSETNISLTPSPVLRTFAAETPFSIRTHDMRIYFEIEQPRRGQISVATSTADTQTNGNTIDVCSMSPGEIVDIYREDGLSYVHLNLLGGGRESLNTCIEWLPE
ncbi:MAG: hypothetical protein Q9219_005054 [cf. Caloplaca sp. 3 TL-2023]